ncbi:hypothetical protein Tco_0874626 [Tanacetum coccineum]|uniref:Uncharacterized protein n=1 Tax=Tanacetum coccineum TaxID=301880 RepID=A0ABQ5BM68_9ASTR
MPVTSSPRIVCINLQEIWRRWLWRGWLLYLPAVLSLFSLILFLLIVMGVALLRGCIVMVLIEPWVWVEHCGSLVGIVVGRRCSDLLGGNRCVTKIVLLEFKSVPLTSRFVGVCNPPGERIEQEKTSSKILPCAMNEIRQSLAALTTTNTAIGGQNGQMVNPGFGRQANQFSRLEKVESPKFQRDNVRDWAFKRDQFFAVDNTLAVEKVKIKSVHLDDKALLWHI